jgi:asparagine synthase (glutamine-hydrolysing)
MPGLVGLVTTLPRARAEAELLRMIASLRHESFYTAGTWIDETLGVYAGWIARRGSFSERMPIRRDRCATTLLFSGEEYSGAASDPVHLIDAAADPRFPSQLNGRFHGLLADVAGGTATLFNDRFGMHRLYYHESTDAFYFAAEAKAILAVRPELRQLDLRGAGEYLSCGCVLDNRSLFRGVNVLPVGSAWVFRGGSLARRSAYFDSREWEAQSPLDAASYYRELRAVMERTLPRYFAAQEPVAMSLTGGLDTRMIMAWQPAPPGSLPCYTFGGMFRESQDVRIARRVARACGQPHAVIPVGQTFLSRFPRYAERTVFLTDGCADVSRSPDLYVNEQAREIAPVRMTGNYGGEVLRRVRAFKPLPPPSDLFRPELVSCLRQAAETYQGVIQTHPLSFAVFRQAPWHHHGLLALEQTQLSLRSPYLDNDFVRTVFRAPEATTTSNEVCLRLIADGRGRLDTITTDRGSGGLRRVSAAASRGLREFQFKAEYAYDYGMPQWVARIDRALSPLHLERLFLGRHKFYHFRIWYRDALSPYLREMLLDRRSLARPYLEPRRVEAMVRAHVAGRENHTVPIHKLLTLELLHRLFLDS